MVRLETFAINKLRDCYTGDYGVIVLPAPSGLLHSPCSTGTLQVTYNQPFDFKSIRLMTGNITFNDLVYQQHPTQGSAMTGVSMLDREPDNLNVVIDKSDLKECDMGPVKLYYLDMLPSIFLRTGKPVLLMFEGLRGQQAHLPIMDFHLEMELHLDV